jgi:hypothetical protein
METRPMFHNQTARLTLAATVAFASLFGCATPMANTAKTPALEQGANADTNSSLQAEQADERDMEDYGLTADEASAARYDLMAKPEEKGGKPAADVQVTAAAKADDKGGQKEGAQAARDAAKDARDAAKDAAKAAREAFKAALKAEVKAKVQARLAEKEAKSKSRRAEHQGEHDAVAKAAKGTPWVDNGDGTKSKTFESDVTRTVNGQTFTRHIKMVRTQNADGVLCAAHTEFSETRADGSGKTTVRDKSLQ